MDGVKAYCELVSRGFEVRKVDTALGGIGLKVHGQGKGSPPPELLRALQADRQSVIDHLDSLEAHEDGLRRTLRFLRIHPFD